MLTRMDYEGNELEQEPDPTVTPQWSRPRPVVAPPPIGSRRRYQKCEPCGVSWYGDQPCWAPDHRHNTTQENR